MVDPGFLMLGGESQAARRINGGDPAQIRQGTLLALIVARMITVQPSDSAYEQVKRCAGEISSR